MRMRRAALLLAALGLFAGCAEIETLRESPVPDARPAPPNEPTRSGASLEQQAYYQRIEQNFLARGLLRADGGGPDTPFTDEMLARAFLSLAFSEEFTDTGGFITARSRASTLHRWAEPVRIETVFGGTVQAETRARDRALIETYARRLARATRHEIGTTGRRGNFTVFILHEQDLGRIGPRLRSRLPEISDAAITFVETLPLDQYCVVFTSDPGGAGRITAAAAVIRAELPPALRISCLHEELAQGLGLANDSDLARPSIFRDDDEFGRLTTFDERLLGLLYDPALTPGMTEGEAAPLVRQLARAMMTPAS